MRTVYKECFATDSYVYFTRSRVDTMHHLDRTELFSESDLWVHPEAKLLQLLAFAAISLVVGPSIKIGQLFRDRYLVELKQQVVLGSCHFFFQNVSFE